MRGASQPVAGLVVWLTLGAFAGCDLAGGAGVASRGEASPSVSASAPTSASVDGDFEPTDEDHEALEALMDQRAAAIRAHRARDFLATVDPRQPKLRATQKTLFENLVALPLASLEYDVAAVYLTPARVPGGDPVVHPQVLEQLGLLGVTDRPIGNKLDLTFVRRDGTWYVGAERKPGAKGSVEEPQERPWFGVPIAVDHDGRLTVIVDADAEGQLDGLVSTVRDGIQRDADILGIPAADRVLVDATSNGIEQTFRAGVEEEIAATTFPLTSAELDTNTTELAGIAIKINPTRVEELIDDDRLLWHELTHYLLFDRSASTSPAWLSEGVASFIEWHPVRMSQLVVPDAAYEAVQRTADELPTGTAFYDDPTRNYLIAQAAVQWLVDRGGTARLLDLIAAYRQSRTDPDDATAKLLRRVYGVSVEEVLDGAFANLATLHH